MVVAEVDRDVGEPPTSQSITSALILYKTSFKVYLSEVPCWNLSESEWKMGHWNIFTWPIKSWFRFMVFHWSTSFAIFFCFPPSLFSNVTFPYFYEDESRLNCYFCLFSSFRCITVCKCFVSITFNTIVIMISFPNSNAKHRFRSVNFPENKKRLLLYHYLQGMGLLIDRNSTAFSSV